MPTAFTERLLIVVRAAFRAQADAVALIADPTTTAQTFKSPLKFTTNTANTPDVYWSQWTMTPDQRSRLIAEFGRNSVNFKVYAKGDNVQTGRDFWVFEAAEGTGWTPGEVLAVLGLTFITSAV